jgi:hypothetical protein
MCLILNEFVYGFNDEYKDLIILPQVGAMSIVTKEFKNWCSLSLIYKMPLMAHKTYFTW